MLSRVKGGRVDSLTSTGRGQDIHLYDWYASGWNPCSMDVADESIRQDQVSTTRLINRPAAKPSVCSCRRHANNKIPFHGGTPYTSLGVMEDMLNTPAQLDWRLDDRRIFGLGTVGQDNDIWYPPAMAAPELDVDGLPPGL